MLTVDQMQHINPQLLVVAGSQQPQDHTILPHQQQPQDHSILPEQQQSQDHSILPQQQTFIQSQPLSHYQLQVGSYSEHFKSSPISILVAYKPCGKAWFAFHCT